MRIISPIATLTQTKEKIILPLTKSALEFSLSSFSTINDLSKYLTSKSGTPTIITDLNGNPFLPSSNASILIKESFYICVNSDYYKVLPQNTMCLFDAHNLFDHLNIKLKDRQILQHNLDNINKLYKLNKEISKDSLIYGLHKSIESGIYEHIDYKNSISEMVREKDILDGRYKVIRKKSDSFVNKTLWGILCLLVSQTTYIGVGTYVFFSWDIMEPQAYLINLGNIISVYAGFCYGTLSYKGLDIIESLKRLRIEKICKNEGFDLEKYEELGRKLMELKTRH